VVRKELSFGDTTTMVIANPAQAERCITSDDENEVCYAAARLSWKPQY